MKIVFLLSSLEIGGAQKQVVNLSFELQKRGHDVMIISMTNIIDLRQQINNTGATLECLNMHRGIPDPRGLMRAITLLKKWTPDILVGFMYHANILSRIAGRLAAVPVVISSVRSENFSGKFDTLLMKVTDRLQDITVVNSGNVSERLIQKGILAPDRCTKIPNGIDVDSIHVDQAKAAEISHEFNVIHDEYLWIAVGRLHEAKGYPTLLQAFQKAAEKFPKMKLIIVGDGPDFPSLQKYARELDLLDKVSLTGARRDVPAFMAAADSLVLSSWWEGLPNVVMEASASGKPVVSTDVGGVRELIVDGRSGFIVKSRDVESLADGMMKMMQLSPEERSKLGRNGQEYIRDNFSMNQVTTQWLGLFKKLLATKTRMNSAKERGND